MKVLVFTNLWPGSTIPRHGGFVRERVLRLQKRMGFDFEVVHPLPRYPRLRGDSVQARQTQLPREETYEGVRIHYPRYFHVPRFGLGKQAKRMARGARRVFADCVRRLQPDLVDAHYLYPDACAALQLAEAHAIPCVATARGSDVNVLGPERGVREIYARELPKASQVMTVSSALARDLERFASLPENSVVTMRNGVDLERFDVGDGAPAPRVLCLARLAEIKRVDLLVRAMQHVPEPFRLELIGGGPLRATLEALRDELGLGARLHFHGELDRGAVAAELAKGGVFALASRHEGWPNALMEGLASGMFAVATRTGGIPEILDGDESAAGTTLPVDAGSEAWGAALARACEGLQLGGRAFGAGARARAEELSWEGSLEALQAVFERACARRGR